MTVRYEVADNIAVITLNRPEALNAFTDAMELELLACFDQSDADDDVRVVVITGAGRAFCAGMDLAPSEDGQGAFETWRASPGADPQTKFRLDGEPLPVRRDGGGRVVLRIFASTKPVIAAVNGDAVGVGITLTLPCDLRVMAHTTRLAFPFTKRGFVPESCSSWFLPRVVPVQRAMEWMLTGRRITAAEALDAGLALSLHRVDEVLPAAMRIAREIATGSAPVSASITRQLLWRMLTAGHPMVAHEIETRALNDLGIRPDAHEGTKAFLQKRTPVFADKVSESHPYLADLPDPAYTPPEAIHGCTPRES